MRNSNVVRFDSPSMSECLAQPTVGQYLFLSGFGAVVAALLFSACTGVSGGDSATHVDARHSSPAAQESARAQLAPPLTRRDGEYTAQVSTWTETYRGPVKVAGGRVVAVYWPKWGRVVVTGGKLTGDFAEAVTSHGEMVRIELEQLVNNG